MRFSIGESNGKTFHVDLEKLLRTRLLVQANSGGGKSYVLRKLLEETYGKVQHLVLDPEGEFSTLREKFDYILVGKGGDLPADVRTAPLLAERLLQLGASAIIDLYELHQDQRIRFVRLFLDAMVNVDKKLWHPCMVVVDEAHIFAPENGESEALSSVIDICTRGRKRSFCAVLATQRLSKLHKDAAAECNNKLIGRTGLDIDLKRAAYELGFTAKEDIRSLKVLEPGSFFAFGPAISPEVLPVKIGAVSTTHYDVGGKQTAVVPPPQEKVKQILSKLADLPQEQEEREKTKADYEKTIRELKARLKEIPKPVTQFDEVRFLKEVDRAKAEMEREMKSFLSDLQKLFTVFTDNVFREEMDLLLKRVRERIKLPQMPILKYAQASPPAPVISKAAPIMQKKMHEEYADPNAKPLGAAERLIVSFLASNSERSWSKEQVAIMTGRSPKSSGFDNALSTLNTAGYLVRGNGSLKYSGKALPAGIDTGQAFSVENIKPKLGYCELQIFNVLLRTPETEFSKEELAGLTLQKNGEPYSPKSSGYDNSLSRCSSLGILSRSNGKLSLSDDVKELL